MKRVKWDYASVKEEAGKYSTVRSFKEGSRGAYKWAQRNGVIAEVVAKTRKHKPNGYWSEERCMEISLKYESLSDFLASEMTCYKRAHENGFLHKITAHLDRSEVGVCDNDAVYCWIVTDSANDDLVSPMPGHNLCKVGVTSQRLGEQRPTLCASDNGMGMSLIGIMETRKGEATDYEKLLLSLGTEAGVPQHYDGYTEFRIFTDEEVNEVEQLLCA